MIDKVHGEIFKSDNVKIVVSEGEYKGVRRIDIREYWKPEDQATFVPTKKGISVPEDEWDDLFEILKKVNQQEGPKAPDTGAQPAPQLGG